MTLPNPLHGKTLAVLGYGSQGRAHALNLRDSGAEVRLGLRPDGASWKQACADGWRPMSMAEATEGADMVCFLMPDTAQPAAFRDHVEPNLAEGATLMFAHGFNIHYGTIAPAAGHPIILIAPKGPGALVRREFERGRGVPCLTAVHADPRGDAAAHARAYADAIGGGRAGILETNFAEETETDLFGEQAVLCGGATELVVAGFETLVEAGYQPEVAYYECLHELKLIVDLLQEGGLARMHRFISDTAKFGDLSRGKRVIDEGARARMKEILAEIQDGRFAREWLAEDASGRPRYDALLRADLEHPIEAVGARLRASMPWLEEGEAAAPAPAADKGAAEAPRETRAPIEEPVAR
ncbi:MAG: ketol-acid reductoisomerase [Planctomycetota bacterium]|jgi:ketol-acid reductoisomerase